MPQRRGRARAGFGRQTRPPGRLRGPLGREGGPRRGAQGAGPPQVACRQGPHPRIVCWPRLAAAATAAAAARSCTPREVAKQNPPSPPAPGPSPTLGSESARRRRRRQKEAPPAKFNPRPSSFPSAFTLEGSCTPNAKPPASCLSLLFTITPYFSLFRFILLFKGKPGWQTQKKVASGIVKLLAKSGPPHPSRPKLLTSPATPSQGSRPSFPRGSSP